MTTPTGSPLALRQRVELLIKQWDHQHADWCCTQGCSSPDGQHATDESVAAYLDKLHKGEAPGELRTEPCTGECTCDVGRYVGQLRAALEGSS